MFEVVYYSVCGSANKTCGGITKVAEAIAVELGVKAENIEAKKELDKDSFVFMGSGCYGIKHSEKLSEFIGGNDFNGRKGALFGTSGKGKGDGVRAMEEMLEPRGALIRGSFYCKGHSIPFFQREHPSNEELANAREFANEMRG